MRYCYAALLLAVLGAEACMLPPRQGQQQQTQLPATPSEVEATVRKHELEMERLEGNPVGLQIENTETELIKALKLTLGKESFSPGQPAPRSATTLVKALRETDIKLKLQPVLDDQGQPLGDDLVELTDSYTVRAQQLSRKITEQTATKDEIDEVRAGAKHSAKLGELKLSIMRVSMATTMSNSLVQTSSMGAMLRVANLVGSRKYMRMEFNGEDYGRVKKWLSKPRSSRSRA